MMMKNQTKGNARLRSLALLPAVAVALLVSNSSCVKNAQEQVADSAQPDSTALDALGVRIRNTDGKTVDLSANSENSPLVIIDGKEGSVESLEPGDIESISVLPDAKAKAQYGDRAVNGVLVVTTKESAPEPQNELAVQVPEFKGGIAKLYQMLAENIRYPEDAMNDSIQGRVLVELTVGTDGEIANAKVLKGIHKSLDQAALDAIKRIKEAGAKFTPGIDKDGKPVVTTFVLPVSFKLQ